MAELKDRLRRDLTASIKSRDALRSSTLRLVLAALTNAEVAGKQARQLNDDEVTGVVASEAKKRREAAAAFDSAGRFELAEKERAEARILADYLPEPLSANEITMIVSEAVAATDAGSEGMRAMGRIMGAVAQQTRGRAEGAAVAAEVKRQLGAEAGPS